jgi:hypothetical protein
VATAASPWLPPCSLFGRNLEIAKLRGLAPGSRATFQVSTDNTHGMLTATVQEHLADASGIKDDITIMGNSAASVTAKAFAVRPGQALTTGVRI